MPTAKSASFQRPDEVREFDHGRLEVVSLGDEPIGRQILEPDWRGQFSETRIATLRARDTRFGVRDHLGVAGA